MTAGGDVVRVSAATPYKDITQLLADRGISAVPVVDDASQVLGVVSEADLLSKESRQEPHKAALLHWRRERALQAKSAATTASELMTSPAVTIGPDEDVVRAARLMEEHRVNRLPVVDEHGHLAGIVSRSDLLSVFLRSDDQIRSEVTEDVILGMLWVDPDGLDVSVRRGMVTIRGEVETRSVADLIGRLARRVDGVVGVVNELAYTRDDRRDRVPSGPYLGVFQHRGPKA